MLAGLLHPTAGRVEVAGFDPWTGGAAFKRRFALVLGNKQQLMWDLPPEETFLVNRAIYGIAWADYRRTLDELVELLRLGDVLGRPVRQLSQGERMKCELAAALLHRPEILFLDEPTLGLDVTAQETIRAFVRDYSQRHGATVLLTSHYMADVTALAQRVLIIDHGTLLYNGALAALGERTLPVKRVTLVLAADDVARDALASYGDVRNNVPKSIEVAVQRWDEARVSAWLQSVLPVLDLGICVPSVEEVIREVFEGAARAEP